MASKLKKLVDDSKEGSGTELDLVDKGIVNIPDIPGFASLKNLTKLVLAHNKISSVPQNLANYLNLEIIVLFNNIIEELPTTLSSLPKLKILNVGMNRLNSLPRGFGACPMLEVLDVTYNNLNENSLPANFFCLDNKSYTSDELHRDYQLLQFTIKFVIEDNFLRYIWLSGQMGSGEDTLRALYMGDNDFEYLPPEIGRLKNLQVLVLRENDLVELPKEMGELIRLRELHIQGNRLTVLPPEMGNLDLVGTKQVFKADNNPWVTPIADQFQVGVSHVFDYIRSDTYKFLYGRHIAAKAGPPPKTNDKTKKISRLKK